MAKEGLGGRSHQEWAGGGRCGMGLAGLEMGSVLGRGSGAERGADMLSVGWECGVGRAGREPEGWGWADGVGEWGAGVVCEVGHGGALEEEEGKGGGKEDRRKGGRKGGTKGARGKGSGPAY